MNISHAMRASALGLALLLAACQGGRGDTTAGAETFPFRDDAPTAPWDKGEYSPASFLMADCLALATAFDPDLGAAFCDAVFGPLDQPPPVSYEDCIAQGSALDPARAEGFCAFIYPFVGYSSPSHVQGPNHYLQMPDGVLIAINIRPPENYVPGRRYPVVVEMSGYESGSSDGQTPAGDLADIFGEPFAGPMPLQGGTRAAHGKYYEQDYVSIVANVRGSGCSGGEFDLFSNVSAWDGHHLIEWAAAQPWSNGEVGLFGHSYSGITATMIATTRPPSLKVLSISGLLGDLYRDIVYPGGLTNYGFPLLWTGGVRLAYDVLGGSLAGVLADNGDRQCLRNQAARSRTVLQDPVLNGMQDWDGEWYRSRSVIDQVHNIEVPTQVLLAYQDEQTGPRGATSIYDALREDIPRRLILLNGNHDSHAQLVETIAERKAWLDYWLLDEPNPFVDPLAQRESVRVLLEVSRLHAEGPERSNGEILSADFPLPETDWTDFYLQADGSLDTQPPGEDGHTTYFHGSRRQFYSYQAGVDSFGEITSVSGPDELMFRSAPFEQPMVIAGPATASLFLQASPAELPAPAAVPVDLEIMIQLLDEDPDGHLSYLQRGVLRAAHRAIDVQRSQYTNEGRIYRPWRPHAGPVPDLILASELHEYLVEIFPVGHVFRPGHRLVVKIHSPALDDNDWIYIPKSAATLASLFHDSAHPSSLMLPVIPLDAVDRLGPDIDAPCLSARVRCVLPGM